MTGPVRITIPAEHVPVLRADLRNLLAIEADNVVTHQKAELQGYDRREDMTRAMRQIHQLTGLLSELGFAPRAREHAVTLTASTEVLGTHYTEQLDGLDEYLCESTIDGERPEDLDEQLELRAAMRYVLAQIPGQAVAA